jgi:hypothetical protein
MSGSALASSIPSVPHRFVDQPLVWNFIEQSQWKKKRFVISNDFQMLLLKGIAFAL